MKLTRIRLEQFKQFRQPLAIEGLDDGLNLFTGPNEAGKSTVVAAIRAAFFERHRSSSVDELRPWGDASASPTVEVDFELAGQSYRLAKSFLGKKRCELKAGGQKLDGALAEDHLAELLGFQYAGKGVSAAQHWGIPGLLWIQQGAGHDIREPVAHATGHLRTALNASLGEVASSGGDEVLASVEAQRNELLTPAGGAPRGVHAEAQKRVASLHETLARIDAEIVTYRQKVDLLASLRREHAADASAQPWVAFRLQEQQAHERLSAIERVQESLANDRARATQLDTQIGLLRERIAAFAEQELVVATRAAAVQAAREALAAAGEPVAQWDAKAAVAVKVHSAARDALRVSRQAQTRAAVVHELKSLTRQVQTSATALQCAEQEQAVLQALELQTATTHIDAEALKRLRQQQAKIQELRIQRAAVATRLRFVLAEGAQVELDGVAISGSAERLLLAPAIVQLGALGRLEIAPGGVDLPDLARKADALDDAHAAALQQLGLPSLEAAEERHQWHAQKLAEIRTAAATLKALAPKGVEWLRAEQASLRAKIAAQQAALAQFPESFAVAGEGLSVMEAEPAEEVARQSLEHLHASLNSARVAAGNAQTRLEAAQAEHALALALVESAGRAARLAEANQAFVDVRTEQSALAGVVETKAREVAQARPDILKQDVERFKRSADQLARAFEERKNALLRTEVELESSGARGLEERQAELARDLAQAQRRFDELRRRAAALDYLLKLLMEKRGALTRKLQAPLQKHLNHYLQLLFPDARLEIDGNLTPGLLTRRGVGGPETGAFESLSFGAREQMGLISRLAYADLLKEAGRPTLIILDDALVHSDEARLNQMKRILFDAATRHQILLFTCHPANWCDLGVRARSLQALRTG